MEVDSNLLEEFKQIERDSAAFHKKCVGLAQEINFGHLSVVKLVEDLGLFLVDNLPNNRAQGTWILTEVLEQLRDDYLDNKQLVFLCSFYTDRIKDHHQVVPAVFRGILALANFDHFPNGECRKILSTLFQHISCQQQQENDRCNLYKIFEIFLEKYPSELCSMGLDFVYGVITFVDGERSPKNLIRLFQWFLKFFTAIDLGHLDEEIFEMLACYFPVDFKPLTQDSKAITRDMLADALARCLTAIPKFAEFCFSLALEKFDSSLEIAKLDALKLLELGCENFETASYVSHIPLIWSELHKELFYNNVKPPIEEAALKTLQAIIVKISDDSSFNRVLKDIIDSVKGNLLPGSKLFKATTKLILNVAKASKNSSFWITREIGPSLMTVFNIASTSESKSVILGILVELFDCFIGFQNDVEFDELNKIAFLCLKCSREDNNNSDLVKTGFECLSRISRHLPLEVRYLLYNDFRHLIIISQEFRGSILTCFEKFSITYPIEIKVKVIDCIKPSDYDSLRLFLEALSIVTPQKPLTIHIIDIFLTYLNQNVYEAQIAIECLTKLLQVHKDDTEIIQVLNDKNFINTLVDWCCKNQDCMIDSSLILRILIAPQSTDYQIQILEQQLPKCINLSNDEKIYLLMGLFCCLRCNVPINYNIFDDLVTFIQKNNNDVLIDVASQLLANLINKCEDDRVLNGFLKKLEQQEINEVMNAWIIKALVMKDHEYAYSWTSKLVEKLKSDATAALSFKIIINDKVKSLSVNSYCNRMLFYQQKFFTLVSNQLVRDYKSEYKSFLVVIGFLIEHVHRQAVLVQFKKILKLVILCLDECCEFQTLLVLLKLFRDLMANKEQCMEDNFSDFIPRFLRLATFQQSMKVRVLALQCLQDCIKCFPLYKLLPYKDTVCRGLYKVVDDKKRLVRREAVEARTLWCLLGEPI